MTEFPRKGLSSALNFRLRRMAMIVRILIVIGAVGLVASSAWVWIVPGHAHSQIKEAADVDIDQMALHTQVIGGLWTLLPVGILLLGLHRLWRLFGGCALGRVFGQAALGNLRGFARCVLAMAFVSPLYGAVLSVIVTFDRLPGTRQLNIAARSTDYAMLLIGAVLLAICSVMVEAARIAEDNEGFV